MDESTILALAALERGINLVLKRARRGKSVSMEELLEEMAESEQAHQAFIEAEPDIDDEEGGEMF